MGGTHGNATITSPNYPFEYNPREERIWHIQAETEDMWIYVEIGFFEASLISYCTTYYYY